MRGPNYLSTVGMLLFTLLMGSATFSEFHNPKTNLAADQCKLYVPNAFSPNGDGVNDLFAPSSNCGFQEFEMRIFDRWGTLLFQSKDAKRGWNGKYKNSEVASTAYVYYIRYRSVPIDTSIQTFTEVMTGNFALLR